MRGFAREADETYRKNAKIIDKAYDILAHGKDFKWLHINEITKKLLDLPSVEKIPAATLWAVHRSLLLNEIGFLPDPQGHWKSGMW